MSCALFEKYSKEIIVYLKLKFDQATLLTGALQDLLNLQGNASTSVGQDENCYY